MLKTDIIMIRNLLKKIIYKENNEQKPIKKLTTLSKWLKFTYLTFSLGKSLVPLAFQPNLAVITGNSSLTMTLRHYKKNSNRLYVLLYANQLKMIGNIGNSYQDFNN